MKKIICILLFALGFMQNVSAKNLHVMDESADGKYRIVRTGIPKFKDFQKMCQMGIRRMIVMAGNGATEEEFAKTEWAQKNCQGFQVIYNCKQATKIPLSKQFLSFFDEEVTKAKALGYGLAFRCNCGCHRTGRLAAYYRMKYQDKGPEESVRDQRRKAPGLATFLHRKIIKHQIHALADYIKGKECSGENKEFCPVETDESCQFPQVSDDPDDQI
ncbi:MAG: hypothetical protein H0V66_07035 [Bdellovibrionales bacterium]|nr:hypothetical protein [Bdellovibrionales bacterium]